MVSEKQPALLHGENLAERLLFYSSTQKKSYSDQTDCWRSGGSKYANHFHIFWSLSLCGLKFILETVPVTKISFSFEKPE